MLCSWAIEKRNQFSDLQIFFSWLSDRMRKLFHFLKSFSLQTLQIEIHVIDFIFIVYPSHNSIASIRYVQFCCYLKIVLKLYLFNALQRIKWKDTRDLRYATKLEKKIIVFVECWVNCPYNFFYSEEKSNIMTPNVLVYFVMLPLGKGYEPKKRFSIFFLHFEFVLVVFFLYFCTVRTNFLYSIYFSLHIVQCKKRSKSM